MTESTKLSYKDLVVAYLVGGIALVTDRLADVADPRGMLLKVSVALNAAGQDPSEIDAFMNANYPHVAGSRGRKAPIVGETVRRKVQQLDGQDPHARINLAALSVGKGDRVVVKYADGKITITT
jgi:hypothetical protein